MENGDCRTTTLFGWTRMKKWNKELVFLYLVRDINSPIPKFTNPRFFYRNIHLFIVFFWIEIIQPFTNLKGASKCISKRQWNNHITKFSNWQNIRRLVEINWWIDVTNKILIFIFFTMNHQFSLLMRKNFIIYFFLLSDYTFPFKRNILFYDIHLSAGKILTKKNFFYYHTITIQLLHLSKS